MPNHFKSFFKRFTVELDHSENVVGFAIALEKTDYRYGLLICFGTATIGVLYERV